MSALSGASRESKLVFFSIFTVVAALLTIATTFFLVGDMRGGDATATVVHVYAQDRFSITFVTRDGRRCQTAQRWEPRAGTVNVSDTFEVHYSQISLRQRQGGGRPVVLVLLCDRAGLARGRNPGAARAEKGKDRGRPIRRAGKLGVEIGAPFELLLRLGYEL